MASVSVAPNAPEEKMAARKKSPPPPKRWFSVDIEADGSCPRLSNMRSIGIVVYNDQGDELESWERNLFTVPTFCEEEETMVEFWEKHPGAWKHVNTNQIPPQLAMEELKDLYLRHGGSAAVEWVAKPAAYDWQWVNSYYCQFKKKDWPSIGFKATCISTIKSTLVNFIGVTDEARWKGMESIWTTDLPKESHRALDDARYQGAVFFGARKYMGTIKQLMHSSEL